MSRGNVDPVVVERFFAGDDLVAKTANRDERIAIVTEWAAAGRSVTELERRTGWRAHRYMATPAA